VETITQDLVLIVPKEMVNTGVMVNVNGIVRMGSVYLKIKSVVVVTIQLHVLVVLKDMVLHGVAGLVIGSTMNVSQKQAKLWS